MARMSNSRIGIIAGSGLSLTSLLDSTERVCPFHQFESLVETTVQGHAGRFLIGRSDAREIVIQEGRLHLYEGHDYAQLTQPIDILHSLGVSTLLVTNAVGGLQPTMEPGDLVSIRSVLAWPCRSWAPTTEKMELDFMVDGTQHAGTYMWVHGPCYETPAEIQAMQSLQGDVVGMSSAPEIQRCRELGIRVAGVSCVTNNCCRPQSLSHENVVEQARRASGRLCELIRAALPNIAH